MSFQPTGIRFLTMEEAEAHLFGSAPTHPIYEGDPLWESANYEIGLMVQPDASFQRPIPAIPDQS